MTYALGLDFGTSGARAIAIDGAGTIVAQTQQSFTEQTSVVWRSVLESLILDLGAEVRAEVKAIAINGTSSTSLLCDGSGVPLMEPLMYNDDRAKGFVEGLRAIAPPNHTVLSATSSLAKLLYFQEQQAFGQARYFLHQADWIAAQLHGTWGVSDYHNSLKLGYDVVNLRYPDWLRGRFEPLLPRVVAPGTAIGLVISNVADRLGLPRDCQVYAGTTDSIAAFLASGVRWSSTDHRSSLGEAVTSLGSTLVIKLLSDRRVEDSRYGIYSHRLGNLWLVGGASNTGGAVLRKFFEDGAIAELSGRIDVDRPSGLDYYPLTQPGERFPINDPGLEPRVEPRPEDPVRFLQGLLEGMARIEAEGYRLLRDLGATAPASVVTAGGGAKNLAWMAIRGRCLGIPVAAALQQEAAYGSARLAFLSHQAVNW
ncbi:MAG: FGGY-family carbohydrate kinase [Alkalinema sp. RU_4_3]|nr:FGGY-family carbohydrate kinase [Alkalinema sp. RU_4_3]